MYEIIFTDVITGEQFKYIGFNYECQNLTSFNKEFEKWCDGRILSQDMNEIN
jgi:hypothetical protein